MARSLSLTPRAESTRDKQQVEQIIEHDLATIKGHFDESLAMIKNEFEIADTLLAAGKTEDAKNIWRSQVVFAESILDFYIHELSKYSMVAMFSGKWPKSAKYNNFMLPMASLEKGLNNPESTSWLVELVNSRFSREVYLGLDNMRDQVNLMGLKFEELLATTFPKTGENGEILPSGKQIIRDLFERRNQIAHQLDRKHSDAVQNDITKEYVEACFNNVEKLVSALHNAAIGKESG